MSGADISSLIGGLYAASSQGTDWSEVGQDLFRRLGARSGSLRIIQPDGSSVNFLNPHEQATTLYGEVYRAIDPIRAAANNLWPTGGEWAAGVRTLDELLPAEIYQRSEFYRGFAKPNGQNEYIVAAIGDDKRALMSVFREERPFDADEKQLIVDLLPHLHRAVQLHHRIVGVEKTAGLGHAALEALPGGAFVVDAEARVIFSNAASRSYVGLSHAPFIEIADRSRLGTASAILAVRDRKHGERFRALIGQAAHGGGGGGMRLELVDRDGNEVQLAVMISPHPVIDGPSVFLREVDAGPVLVLVQELSRPRPPPAELLSDLFGLSIAEGAVAVALLGGQTAEIVAAERDVSLDTIRSQIRTILRKSDAANLRDFERIGALLGTLRG